MDEVAELVLLRDEMIDTVSTIRIALDEIERYIDEHPDGETDKLRRTRTRYRLQKMIYTDTLIYIESLITERTER